MKGKCGSPACGRRTAASRVYDTYVLSSASFNFDALANFQIALEPALQNARVRSLGQWFELSCA